ncbi:MAG: ctpC 2 [Firmicutes bacterium]|nr:ctpC 2 [Bacillota bacterium]
MKYSYVKLNLPSKISGKQKLLLQVHLRLVPNIIFVMINELGQATIYFNGHWNELLVKQEIHSIISTTTRRQQLVPIPANEEHASLAEYRRDAVLAFSGFIAMQLLKKVSPQTFLSLKLLRNVFVLFVARKLMISGTKSLVLKRQPNADALTATAVIASVLAGKPESSLTLLALSNFAEMLTIYAADRARKHISTLLRLDQQYTWKIDDLTGHEVKVAIETLQVGDRIAVHIGEKVCVDGKVLVGHASIDQSSITGESIPAEKTIGAQVYAGTVVQGGQLEILVEKVGDETSLARIVHMVEDAQTRRAPVQNFADRMANMLVPISFLSAALVFGATRDWQRVLNMLFIDFSCGLKLSTATAISAAIAMAAKKGILVKGGNYIEALADIDTVILDKTGTITVGTPQITAIKTIPSVSEKELLLLAASTELHSVHPLAVAIQKYVADADWQVPPHITSETIVGRGMVGLIEDYEDILGGEILVGSLRFMKERNINGLDHFASTVTSPELNILYVARNEQLIGLLIINDPIRPDFKKTLNQLRRQGIDEIVMLTGDSKIVAQHVAQTLDMDEFHAEILPEDKATLVTKMQKRGHVLMVGDGINDAPALAFADVGVAMGGRRTDIAVESAAVTINSDDPLKLSEVINLGRDTMQLVRQNFTATITINTTAMLLGALGKINPLVAAIIHNAATIGVVLNSARILLPNKNILIPKLQQRR